MIRQSDLEGLEKVVLDGHGQNLIGETASDNQIRAFIRSVPAYMVSLIDINHFIVNLKKFLLGILRRIWRLE
jgi:hypothetical protein